MFTCSFAPVESLSRVTGFFLAAYVLQVKHAMTLTEKILAKHSDNARLQPGANIWTDVDKLLTHDVCGPGTFGIFEKEFGAGAQVWDPEKVIIIPDHYIFTSDPRANRNVDILRQVMAWATQLLVQLCLCCMLVFQLHSQVQCICEQQPFATHSTSKVCFTCKPTCMS